MIIEGKVGPQVLADGAGPVSCRLGKEGALINSQLHGSYTETAFRGTMNIASNLAAGIAPGTVLALAAIPLFIWNPPSSGKNLSIIKVAMGYVSGTLGAGCIAAAYVPNQTVVPTVGTELTPVNSFLGAPRGVGRAFYTATAVAIPTLIRPIWNIGPMLATSVYQPTDCVDVIDGSIIVPPGTGFCLQGIAGAGTTPLMIFSVEWDEISI